MGDSNPHVRFEKTKRDRKGGKGKYEGGNKKEKAQNPNAMNRMALIYPIFLIIEWKFVLLEKQRNNPLKVLDSFLRLQQKGLLQIDR